MRFRHFTSRHRHSLSLSLSQFKNNFLNSLSLFHHHPILTSLSLSLSSSLSLSPFSLSLPSHLNFQIRKEKRITVPDNISKTLSLSLSLSLSLPLSLSLSLSLLHYVNCLSRCQPFFSSHISKCSCPHSLPFWRSPISREKAPKVDTHLVKNEERSIHSLLSLFRPFRCEEPRLPRDAS